MNEEQRMAEVEKFKNYFSYISRPGADKLLAWLEEAGFFTAPASTKYHGAYAGGLVEHTNLQGGRLQGGKEEPEAERRKLERS